MGSFLFSATSFSSVWKPQGVPLTPRHISEGAVSRKRSGSVASHVSFCFVIFPLSVCVVESTAKLWFLVRFGMWTGRDSAWLDVMSKQTQSSLGMLKLLRRLHGSSTRVSTLPLNCPQPLYWLIKLFIVTFINLFMLSCSVLFELLLLLTVLYFGWVGTGGGSKFQGAPPEQFLTWPCQKRACDYSCCGWQTLRVEYLGARMSVEILPQREVPLIKVNIICSKLKLFDA